MSKIDRNDIWKVYSYTLKRIEKLAHRENYHSALKHIVFAAKWMYNFNLIYADKHLDDIIRHISSDRLKPARITIPIPDRAVLIDNFGLDNRGLTQQYIRGLIANGKKILYILHNESPINNSEIIQELNACANAEIKIYKTSNYDLNTVQQIIDDIVFFSPKDILLHIAPWDVVTLLAISSINGAVTYNINLTDHAFWLGSSLIDYNLEFRGYGELLSVQKRGLKPAQQIRVPYYPIISKYSKFEGFPELPNDAIKIFCGGAEYKMLGKNGIFFRLMDSLLEISEKAHILVAGMVKDSIFGKNVENMRNRNRVHIIGTRKDINEIFAHSDIFLGSYPFLGGLMTQYAANNKLPILAYAEPGEVNTCDSLVNHLGNPLKTRRSFKEFVEYAKLLIDDPEFRKQEGINCFNAMVSKAKFDDILNQTMEHHHNDMVFEPEQPDYNNIEGFYLDVENNYIHSGEKMLLRHYKFNALMLMPKMAGLYLRDIISTICRKIGKR